MCAVVRLHGLRDAQSRKSGVLISNKSTVSDMDVFVIVLAAKGAANLC